MVTYSDLFAYTLVLIGIIGLAIQIISLILQIKKKK